jgi:nitrate reductase gamma subunit
MQWLNVLFLIAVLFLAYRRITNKNYKIRMFSKDSIPIALLLFVASSVLIWLIPHYYSSNTDVYALIAIVEIVICLATATYVVLCARAKSN